MTGRATSAGSDDAKPESRSRWAGEISAWDRRRWLPDKSPTNSTVLAEAVVVDLAHEPSRKVIWKSLRPMLKRLAVAAAMFSRGVSHRAVPDPSTRRRRVVRTIYET
jgi:hypothetical protein